MFFFCMMISAKDIQMFHALEESLWVEGTRFDALYMENTLHEDFFEFGRSGRIYTRDETISAPMQKIDIKLPLTNFMVHPITDDVYQTTYISEVMDEGVLEKGNRSSIWVKTKAGWKLRFHQGTVA